jgi:hypothetical protein
MQRPRSPKPATARRGLAILVAATVTALLVGVVPALAAGAGSVDGHVTVTRAAACLEISTTAVDFGTQPLGAENAPGTPEIVVTNCGDGPESLLASGTNATGTNAAWTLVDSTETCADTLGTDRYHLGLATQAGVPIANLASENKDVGTLATGGSATHSARISTACAGSSGTGATLDMQINYLVTNTEAEPIVLEELTMNQATADAAAAYLFDGAQDITIAPNCATDPSVGCVGGVPVNPAPQVHAVGTGVVATEVVGQGRWDVAAHVGLTSPLAIPVTIQGSACSLTFNTAAGANPDLTVSVQMTFLSYPNAQGPKNYIQLGNPTVTGLETADFQLAGGFICSLAQSFSGFILGQLEAAIANQFGAAICGDPNSSSFIACPPLQ